MEAPGTIVVGTDGSETAERAVDRAGTLARALGVTVHVVSGYKASASQMAARSDQDRTRAQQHVELAQRRLAESGVTSETHIWAGNPAEALLTTADEQGAQMIVVGNRGMTGARRMMGSVPNDISHRAKCSVLIVPTE
ncbi:MAG: universal stress protein [Solirubrobacteraceae bacterium]